MSRLLFDEQPLSPRDRNAGRELIQGNAPVKRRLYPSTQPTAPSGWTFVSGRFKAILVQKDSHYLEVCRYVVLNAVRAKTVKHPREWPWSSYRATCGVGPVVACLTVDELLSHFGTRRGPAQEKYRQYVGEGIAGTTIWENLEAQSLLGMEGFADALRGHVSGKEMLREIPKGQRLIGRASLKKLFDKPGKEKAIRDRLIIQAVKQHGYSQMEVARHLKLHYSTVSRLITSVTEEQR